MPRMGRSPTVHTNLPKGMRARRQKSGKMYYYLDTGAKPRHEIPLGDDYVAAVGKWAELTISDRPIAGVITFRHAAEQYQREALPLRAPRTQKDYLNHLAKLLEFFDNPPAPLNQIEPQHVRLYLDWRGTTAKVQANREKAVLSVLWNFAREKGLTNQPNPCSGVRGFPETGRAGVYIENDVFAAVYAAASQALKDAMDLAFLSGQRPADVLRMTAAHIKNDMIAVRQGKTGKALRIKLNGEDGQRNALGRLIDEIMERKRSKKIADIALVCAQGGTRLTAYGLDSAFDRARIKAASEATLAGKNELAESIRGFQFRDLRAKAGTDKADSDGILAARRQLGHASVTMTEHYVRQGNIVTPTK